jgi:two-component system KDP operon response regulator KdpE
MSTRKLVLVIDHEAEVLYRLKPMFEANNYGATRARTVAEGLTHIAADAPDLVLLDPGLPDGDGKEIIKQVRQWSDVPIIVVSADQWESAPIEALDLGADDYISKPFGVGELLARMRKALRNRARRQAETPTLQVSNLELDSVHRKATRLGTKLKLTPKEFDLLSFLAKHAGRVLTHKQILSTLWGPGHSEDTHYLRVYINQLRRKVEDCAEHPRFILTEPGVGYRMAKT